MIRYGLILLTILLYNPCYATDYFVDDAGTDTGGCGTTMDNACDTVAYMLVTKPLGGDIVWVRRAHNEIPVASITFPSGGTPIENPQIMGWPRASQTINCDWAEGSTTVDNVDGSPMVRESHLGRYITGPDGGQYLITQITDTNTFIIDREYASTTAANENVDISADEDYATRSDNFDDSGWTIKASTWDADAATLPLIDFNSTAYQMRVYLKNYVVIKNMEFRDSSLAGEGIVEFDNSTAGTIKGCLFLQNDNEEAFKVTGTHVYMERIIVEGDSAGAGQRGILLFEGGSATMKDCAVYNMGDNGIRQYYGVGCYMDNVNVGVEAANDDDDFFLRGGGRFYGKDVWAGGTNGYLQRSLPGPAQFLNFENWGKELGKHWTKYLGGTWESVAVTDEATISKKLSDIVIKITPDESTYELSVDLAVNVFVHEFEVDTTQRTWKYWIFNNVCGTLNSSSATQNVFLKLEYLAVEGDDATEYVIDTAYSTETNIADASDSADWDYLQVSNITPVGTAKVRISGYVAEYDADGNIFIDPQYVNP